MCNIGHNRSRKAGVHNEGLSRIVSVSYREFAGGDMPLPYENNGCFKLTTTSTGLQSGKRGTAQRGRLTRVGAGGDVEAAEGGRKAAAAEPREGSAREAFLP